MDVDRALRRLEEITGTRPETCPWQAFTDPEVAAVLDLWRVAQTGSGAHLASVLQLNPPHYVWDGLQLYAHAVAKVRDAHDTAVEKLQPN